MMRVWPAETATGGISFLAADLGSVGALAGPGGFEGTESVQSMEMENWTGERFGDLDLRGARRTLLTLMMPFLCNLLSKRF